MAAKAQRLPKNEPDPKDYELAECPHDKCESTATRFVLQHLCDKKGDGYRGVVSLEVPAYVLKSDKKKPHKWKCPVCKDKDLEVVLIKCGECGRAAKFV